MTTWQLLLTSWDFHPTVVTGCALLCGAYFVAVFFKINAKTINFTLGVLVILLALCSPVDDLGDDYLFSAHMLQHIMLGLIVPPLLVAGLPAAFVRSWLRFRPIASLERILSYPPLALGIAIATFWIWHFPALYDATLQNEAVHIFEHLTFLVTGTILWWPVFKPIPEGKLAPLSAIIYLGTAAFLNAILGVIFSISDTPFYAGYAHPRDELGALYLIREKWGLDQLSDQKLGGAIMWALGGVIFLWGMMMVMIDWFNEPEGDHPQLSERRTESVS